MKDLLKAISFEDHGDYVSGICPLRKERAYLTRSGNSLALQCDFNRDAGDEITGLTCIHECDMKSRSWPEFHCEEFIVPLGEAVTESDLKTVHMRIRPHIDEYKKIFDSYQSDDSNMELDELRESFADLRSEVDDCLSHIALDLQSMRRPGETAEGAFYDSGLLEYLVTPDLTNAEIKEIAIQSAFLDQYPFHPDEIAEALTKYRDNLLAEMED
ncbi:hypothetical protein [Marinobacter sp. tcs-11]|uniref:hypothetical protein n=1 Tax=Marinobacter sp. tcs-11 TaxID=1742860 RepID=UPI00257D5CEC|nr:hypothetical protein [Marinobacter sp. tcs-11]